MIQRPYAADADITVVCDRCGEGYDTDTADFHAAIRAFKREGGQVRYNRGDFDHICSDCVEIEREDDFEAFDD